MMKLTPSYVHAHAQVVDHVTKKGNSPSILTTPIAGGYAMHLQQTSNTTCLL